METFESAIPEEARHEAKLSPNGWVYKIAGEFGPDDVIPPDAIEGAWKVNSTGIITGGFIPNAKFNPKWGLKKVYKSDSGGPR